MTKGRYALSVLALCAVLFSCELYDDRTLMPTDSGDNSFSYVDATDYAQWVYLNLEDGTSVALEYNDEADIPEEWTFALHRYDCKTNGGTACETEFSSLEALEKALSEGTFSVKGGDYVADVEDSIYIDLSHMIDSVVVYAPSLVNKELSKWMDLDLSFMPPIYTPSGRVYIICTRQGVYGAIRFTGYSNPYYYDAKGYISFDYIYPLEV